MPNLVCIFPFSIERLKECSLGISGMESKSPPFVPHKGPRGGDFFGAHGSVSVISDAVLGCTGELVEGDLRGQVEALGAVFVLPEEVGAAVSVYLCEGHGCAVGELEDDLRAIRRTAHAVGNGMAVQEETEVIIKGLVAHDPILPVIDQTGIFSPGCGEGLGCILMESPPMNVEDYRKNGESNDCHQNQGGHRGERDKNAP